MLNKLRPNGLFSVSSELETEFECSDSEAYYGSEESRDYDNQSQNGSLTSYGSEIPQDEIATQVFYL